MLVYGKPQGYSTLSRNIIHFSELNDLPMSIDLDKGNGIEATLLEHEAKWHKSCHNVTQLKKKKEID